MIQLIADLLFAGSETTSTSLLWWLLYIIIYPDVQRKCRAEIHEVGSQDDTCICVYTRVHARMCAYIHVRVCMNVCVYSYMYMFICVCVWCMCAFVRCLQCSLVCACIHAHMLMFNMHLVCQLATYTVRRIVYTVHCTLYSVQYTLNVN